MLKPHFKGLTIGRREEAWQPVEGRLQPSRVTYWAQLNQARLSFALILFVLQYDFYLLQLTQYSLSMKINYVKLFWLCILLSDSLKG